MIMLAFLGRLMFPIGSRDKWQLVPCFFGSAGSGKSLIIDVVSEFFSSDMVHSISNITEERFGLEHAW